MGKVTIQEIASKLIAQNGREQYEQYFMRKRPRSSSI